MLSNPKKYMNCFAGKMQANYDVQRSRFLTASCTDHAQHCQPVTRAGGLEIKIIGEAVKILGV